MSTRLALFFGTGAANLLQNEENGHGDSYRAVVRTVRVLGGVEFAKDNDRFVSQVPTVNSVFRMFWMRDPIVNSVRRV